MRKRSVLYIWGSGVNEVRLGKEKVLFCNHLLGKSLTQYLSKNRLGPPLCIVQLSVFSVKTQQPRSGKTNSWIKSRLKLCFANIAKIKGPRDFEEHCKDS